MPVLPAEFADLGALGRLGAGDRTGRYAKRLASTMPQMQEFYDAAFPGWPTSWTTATSSTSTICRGMSATSCT